MTNVEVVLAALEMDKEWAELTLTAFGFGHNNNNTGSRMWSLSFGFGFTRIQAFTSNRWSMAGASCVNCHDIHRPPRSVLDCTTCSHAWEKLNERHADHL
jgi:hypothetical protein